MNTQQHHITFDVPKAEENTDFLWKKCRHCGKSFRAAKAFYICCSWDCTVAHRKGLEALNTIADEYKGHPF